MIDKAEEFVSHKGSEYMIYRVKVPFARENPELYDGLHALAWRWDVNSEEVVHRFSTLDRKRSFVVLQGDEEFSLLGDAQDVAYIAVDPLTNEGRGRAVSDVLVFGDTRYTKLGIICCVHTLPEYEGQGLCTELIRRSIDDWFNGCGEFLVLHTEFPNARRIYEKAGFQYWIGSKPEDDDFSVNMQVMLKKNPNDGRTLRDIVGRHFGEGLICGGRRFDYDANLSIGPLLRSDYAQFLLLCAGKQYETVQIPAMQVNGGYNAEDRFTKEFLLGNVRNIRLALKTADGRLVGVGARTYSGSEVMESYYVHHNYSFISKGRLEGEMERLVSLRGF